MALKNDGKILLTLYNNDREVKNKFIELKNGEVIYISDIQNNQLLIQINENGDIEWAKELEGIGAEEVLHVTNDEWIGLISSTKRNTKGNYENGDIIENESYRQIHKYKIEDSPRISILSKEEVQKQAEEIIKYNQAGEIIWKKRLLTEGTSKITSIVDAKDNGLIVSGNFNGTINIENGIIVSSGGTDSGIIVKYAQDGQVEWFKKIGKTVNGVAQISNGDIIAVGNFENKLELPNGSSLRTTSDLGAMIVTYNEKGEIKEAKGLNGKIHEEIHSIISTDDGGVVIGAYFKKLTELENGLKARAGTLIKYNANGKIEWAKGLKGTSIEESTNIRLANMNDGIICAASNTIYKITNSGKIEMIEGLITKSEGTNKLVNITEISAEEKGKVAVTGTYDDNKEALFTVQLSNSIPEAENITAKNNLKQFKITTSVKTTDGNKGGTISGEGQTPYEVVKYDATNQYEIKMTPDTNYEIIKVMINGEEVEFNTDSAGNYTMAPLTNIKENKHIEVTYALKDNKIIINKVNEANEPIAETGAKFALEKIDTENPYYVEIETNNKGQAITQIPFGQYTLTEITAPTGYAKLSKPVTIDFQADTKQILTNENAVEITVENGEFIVKNKELLKVTVHHYLKNKNGEETTIKVAPDEILEQTIKEDGKVVENYISKPHLDLEKYELEKDDNKNYIVPNNATGKYAENNEVRYYYVEKQIPITVYHYIKETTTSVPLKEGITPEDLIEEGYTYEENAYKTKGYEGDNYLTKAIPEDKLSPEYELVEVIGEYEGIIGEKEITVTYLYKRIERKVSIIKKNIEGEVLEGAKFKIKKDTDEIADEMIFITDEDGKIKTTLEAGEYTIEEIEAPEGYQLPENPITKVTITRETTEEKLEITNEKIKGTVIVHHYIKGTTEPIKVINEETNKIEEAKSEEKTGYIGTQYATKVKENLASGYQYDSVVTKINEEYSNETSGEYIEGTIEITYYYIELINIDVIKKWNHANNSYGKPESITIELYADGVTTNKEIKLTEANKIEIEEEPETEETWKYTFEKLPKYTEERKEIKYTILEKNSN